MDPDAIRENTVNDMAHALRNVMNALRLKSDALLLAIGAGDTNRPLAEGIRREVDRLLEAVEEMLRFGRPYHLEPDRFALGPFLEELADTYRRGEPGTRAEVTAGPVPPDLEVAWDRSAIRVALERIVDNAVQHTPEPHRVAVSARPTDGEVVVEVRDEGEGIPPEVLPRVTEPFFPSFHGRMGLGLALAKKMVRAHGGRLEVESAPGAGTTVRLVLPREAASA